MGWLDGLGDLFGGAGDWLSGAADSVGSTLSDIGSGAASAATDAGSAISDAAGSLFNGFTNGPLDPSVTQGPGASAINIPGADLSLADGTGGGGAPISAAMTAGGVGAPGDVGPVDDPFKNFDPNSLVNSTGSGGALAEPLAGTALAAPAAAPNALGLTPTTPSDAPTIGQQAVAGLRTGPAPAVAPPTSIENMWNDPSLGNAAKVVGNNANLLLPAAALGVSAMMQPKTQNPQDLIAQQSQIAKQAQDQIANLQAGKLPAGVQGTIDQQTQQQQAAIRQRYAQMGLSGSTMEQQDLAAVARQAQSQGLQVGAQMAQTALAGLQIPNSIYTQQLATAQAQDKALADSISRFAAAAAGGAVSRAA